MKWSLVCYLIHLYPWWFMTILSMSVANIWASFVVRVFRDIKLLNRAISKNWFTTVFRTCLIKFKLKSPGGIVFLLSCFILSRFSMKSKLNLQFCMLVCLYSLSENIFIKTDSTSLGKYNFRFILYFILQSLRWLHRSSTTRGLCWGMFNIISMGVDVPFE